MAGKPSGIAATANEIAVNSISTHDSSRPNIPIANTTTAIIKIKIVRALPNWRKLV